MKLTVVKDANTVPWSKFPISLFLVYCESVLSEEFACVFIVQAVLLVPGGFVLRVWLNVFLMPDFFKPVKMRTG